MNNALKDWNDRGIRLRLEGDDIRAEGNWWVFTDEVLEELREQKATLQEELRAEEGRRAFAKWMEQLWVAC